jgi:superfamily I DNA/RNA helicase
MRLNANTRIIVGPPGTGKTRRLIELATEVIRGGCPPEHVGYISFTRQAVREASSRIMQVTGHTAEHFTGFKTLHAMIYWLQGHSHDKIITDDELHEVSGMAGNIRIGHKAKARTMRYAHMLTHSRVTGARLERSYHAHANELTGSFEEFLQWVKMYRAYKTRTGRVDFVDMVDGFVKHGLQFPFRHLFIDEAQDFTPDQWAAVALLAKFAGNVYVAGDGDQSIFEWAGAKGRIFDELEGDREILEQSHRVPYWPHFVAGRVLRMMRRKIVYRPTQEQGGVYGIAPEDIAGLPFDNGETWFLLARDNFQVKKLEKALFDRRIFYQELAISSNRLDKTQVRYMRRIEWYNKLLAGQELRPSIKAKLATVVPNLDEAVEAGLTWQQAFSCWPIDKVQYFSSVEDQDKPRVFVGTFHSSKGAEADNVVLLDTCTRRVAKLYEPGTDAEEQAAELKALYVALTRTRKRLFLVWSVERYRLPWQRFIEAWAPDFMRMFNSDEWRNET